MALWLWVVLYLLSSLLWAWILFWGGDEWLEGTILSGLLVHLMAPQWSANALRIFAGGAWLLGTVWFVVGCVEPHLRTVWFL
jgi:hypothetical protein